ncbi:kinase-like domain-containing protein [Rhizophagus irregularis DAOM 181602=DAOM 197198]|uniref:Kinase-like domain-containing protein n=1 Tax=Rhizophagus irregularis (strain DAOM 181602 / DAOM 197198 / MUCL 43194) TaxID=747089 RepID=A0A2H5TZG1_RHIID|nr:kinase-like domain-containing protein [Rhizophagus irregularis DAOM 181602=DAOM 197198]POG67163.1 kinase-like domain-containing protein [Rhizophagus irregularis DAOM 181602=DAOM 197198]|eukprot:XP_025174029.1 kinase-like domain-containing protein [Rhizophagus irregularis DAOM 181602=DAOM 197198]
MNTDNNPFDPTRKLKSSPVPVLFIPFKNDEEKCDYCGIKYSKTLMFEQKYCKNCLFWYVQYITGNNTYLDAHINTNNSQCIKHKATRNNFNTTIIQEWCEYCSEILYFTQVLTKNSNCLHIYNAECEICNYKNRSDYQASSGWVESTLNKKFIPTLYLPWWDSCNQCIVCYKEFKYIHQESKSYCQKWCSRCFIIYTGCRYCLTTNIIFGIADQSQCKKCRRISFIRIDITDIRSGNCIIDELLDFLEPTKFYGSICIRNPIRSPYEVYSFIRNKPPTKGIVWIPYSQVTNLKKIAEGGFSIIYKATWGRTDVAVKKLRDSQNISKHFLNELRSLYQCYDYNFNVIGCHGITQDPITKEYMLILNYAEGGNLHDYLQKYFINLRWNDKLCILNGISYGLRNIHNNNFIHRDIHSGNMLLSSQQWKIGDLGLSQPANNTLSNNEIYGVIPYIAPEIFKGAAFSKESDVYGFGMIMWEITKGCKPFANIEHNVELIYKIIDGKRPEITNDTPECFANLMKKCWDSDPLKRPTIGEVKRSIHEYLCRFDKVETFKQAEKKRLELIQLKQLGFEFSENPHPKAIFTSRALSSLISKASTINSSSMISFNVKQGYITKEYEFDINNIQSLTVSANSSRKRNFEELKNETNETQKNRKYIKVDNLDDECCQK